MEMEVRWVTEEDREHHGTPEPSALSSWAELRRQDGDWSGRLVATLVEGIRRAVSFGSIRLALNRVIDNMINGG